MASLTETSIISRKVIRYGIYLLIFGLIARFTFNVIRTIYLRIFPPPPPEATVKFGILPKIAFPEREFPEGLSFKLETANGNFPKLLDQLPVYKMPPISQTYNNTENAKDKASRLDFDPNGGPILEATPNIYRFTKRNAPATLTMNIVTGVFSIYYDYTRDPTVLTGVPVNETVAKQQIQNYLNSAGLLNAELKDGRYTHQFYRAESTQLIETESLSEANFIKLNIFRKGYGPEGAITSVTPEMPEANVWFTMGKNTREIIQGEYHYYPLDENDFGTYPLKSAEQGWEDLKSGNAFVVSRGENPSGNITVRNIYLAYYDAGQYQEHYQPVIVYQGDNGFLAYVPAVVNQFYGREDGAQE